MDPKWKDLKAMAEFNSGSMETAKDIFDRIVGKHHRELSPMNYENTMKFAQEIANKVHSYAKAKYIDNCECDICQMDYPTFMKSLFPLKEI